MLTLLLYNALKPLLWRSILPAVRVLTPARVRDLLLGCHASVAVTAGRLELGVTALREPAERREQAEVVRLFNTAQLTIRGLPLTLKLRDPPAILAALRIAA